MLRKFFRYILLLIALIVAFGCSQSVRFRIVDINQVSTNAPEEIKNSPNQSNSKLLSGKASYYGEKFHGRYTASGEVYDMNKYTAAHRTLMFGTTVKVTNLWNKKSVIVRINDRGPFKDNRLIDLSKAAARELDMIAAGVIDVRVEILD